MHVWINTPYLALCVIQLATEEESQFPQAAEILRTETYVDIFSGNNTPQFARQKAMQLSKLLKASDFCLSKWALNAVLSGIAESELTSSIEVQSKTRILGLAWHPATDTFRFNVSRLSPLSSITKQLILSRVAQLFDPRMAHSNHHNWKDVNPAAFEIASRMG